MRIVRSGWRTVGVGDQADLDDLPSPDGEPEYQAGPTLQDYGEWVSFSLGDGSSALEVYSWEALAQDAGVPAEGIGFRGFTLSLNRSSTAFRLYAGWGPSRYMPVPERTEEQHE